MAKNAHPRIALLTPYSGGNLGDASIQDAMIANLGFRLPEAQFSGITLNCDNFLKRHGTSAFPLLAHIQHHGTYVGRWETNQLEGFRTTHFVSSSNNWTNGIKKALRRVPVLTTLLKAVRRIPQEILHIIAGYRFLRTHDVLIVSGGGQLNEEWGGPWQHPFGLFKWAVLARVARVPYAVASVGAVKVTSKTSRIFVGTALRMARYRSYRDEHSRDIVAGFLEKAARDPVVPDLAFSLPASVIPGPPDIRVIANGRTVIAISPIAYGKPEWWCFQDRAVHDRYVQEMAQVISDLLRRGYFLLIVWSSLFDDQSIITELLGRLDDKSKQKLAGQMHVPATISTWKDLVATLRQADWLISSRLHSTILGFMSETPPIAISFDPKVDSVMQDLEQTDYLLQISDFTSKDVIDALNRLETQRDLVLQQIASYRTRMHPVLALQYDALAQLVTD